MMRPAWHAVYFTCLTYYCAVMLDSFQTTTAFTSQSLVVTRNNQNVVFTAFAQPSQLLDYSSLSSERATRSSEISQQALTQVQSSLTAVTSSLPSLQQDALQLPEIPHLDIPTEWTQALSNNNIPPIQIPGTSETIPSDTVLLLAAGSTFLLLLWLLTTANNNNTTTSSSSSLDRSVPYDAAARLAYFEWLTEHQADFHPDGYREFQSVYTAQAIAAVTAKKLARDKQRFDNKAKPKPIPKRKETTTVVETKQDDSSSPFFFAE